MPNNEPIDKLPGQISLPEGEATILFRDCYSCGVYPKDFQHRNCWEVWWEAEDDDMTNSDGRGQCWMCDCHKC